MTNKFYFLVAISFAVITLIFSASSTVFVSSSATAQSKGFQSSSSMMSSSVSMVVNGKQKYVKSEHEEFYKDKKGRKPAEVRAYKQAYEKQNENPGIFIRHADTNVKKERGFLPRRPEVTLMNDVFDRLGDDGVR
jgi:hypothetical protein